MRPAYVVARSRLSNCRRAFQQLKEQDADFLLTVKANQRTLHRQIQRQFEGKRQIPFLAEDQEISHGRDITWTLRAKEAPEHIRQEWVGTSWIVEVVSTGTRDGKPFNAKHLFLTSLRTSPECLLQLARNRWSIEGWHWIRDTQLHEDAHRYRGNGAGVMGSLRTAALNLLRLAGFQSIRSGMQSVMHDIEELMAMARRQPDPEPY
jgi:predicted transposase YbfD/YdcC